ncbi:hypothetical protein KAR91_33875 [Candidatus Pacearchaeota archaeon]|nr:hypothetical protein [Candidatus Pacearchaeota archaeon]
MTWEFETYRDLEQMFSEIKERGESDTAGELAKTSGARDLLILRVLIDILDELRALNAHG